MGRGCCHLLEVNGGPGERGLAGEAEQGTHEPGDAACPEAREEVRPGPGECAGGDRRDEALRGLVDEAVDGLHHGPVQVGQEGGHVSPEHGPGHGEGAGAWRGGGEEDAPG